VNVITNISGHDEYFRVIANEVKQSVLTYASRLNYLDQIASSPLFSCLGRSFSTAIRNDVVNEVKQSGCTDCFAAVTNFMYYL